MKRTIVIFLCICIAAVVLAQSSGSTMFVAVKNLDLKSSSGIFASTSGTLEYGAQVSVVQASGDWVEVSSAGSPAVRGWARTANLSSRRILPGDAASATAREVAFAGRGFNQEVENANRSGGNLNYTEVDRMETQRVPMDELHAFLVEGRLSMGAR